MWHRVLPMGQCARGPQIWEFQNEGATVWAQNKCRRFRTVRIQITASAIVYLGNKSSSRLVGQQSHPPSKYKYTLRPRCWATHFKNSNPRKQYEILFTKVLHGGKSVVGNVWLRRSVKEQIPCNGGKDAKGELALFGGRIKQDRGFVRCKPNRSPW